MYSSISVLEGRLNLASRLRLTQFHGYLWEMTRDHAVISRNTKIISLEYRYFGLSNSKVPRNLHIFYLYYQCITCRVEQNFKICATYKIIGKAIAN